MKKYILSFFLAGALVLAGCSQESQENASKNEGTSEKEKAQVTEESAYEKVDPEEDKKLLNSKVIYYETPKGQTPEVHKEAEKVVAEIAKKKKVNVKPNLNDARYRDFIYSVASDVESLGEDQRKKVTELAKFVDKHENKLKNKRIQELTAKIKAGQKLTGKERAELDSLLPIKFGNKINYQKQPTKEQLDKISDKLPHEAKNQGARTGGNDNQGTRTGGNNQDTQPNEDNDQDTRPDEGDNQGTNPDQNNNDNTNNDNNNSNDNNNNDNNNNNGNNNQGGNNVAGNLIGGGNQQQNSSYDPIKARDYAYKWWNKRNNEQYGYYSRVMGGCYDCWYDCTNFVSQAIKEGGIKEQRTGGTYWYYSDEKPSYSWGVANSFYKHFKTRAKEVRNLFDLEVGDVVNADFDHDGDIEHAAIVTKVTPYEVYITQHTYDRKDAKLSAWFNAGYNVYGWKMKTANGD